MTGNAFVPRRRALLLGLGALPLAGCRPGTDAAALVPGDDGQTLRLVGPWEITGLDPSRAGYLFSRTEISETLVEVDDQGHYVAGLASDWQVSPDRLNWRFHLRPGARFHDGSPVTPAAVRQALEFARVKPGGLGMVPIDRIVAGDVAVDIRLRQIFEPLPAVLAHSSTQILAPDSYGASGSVRRIIGSGPYKLTLLEAPQRFVAEFSETWDGPAPAVRRLHYLAVGRGESRALMAENGQADIVYGLDPASWQRLRGNPRLQVNAVHLPRTIYLKLNAGHPLLAHRDAREAISLALDRAGIARAVLRDEAAAAGQLLPPVLPDWHDPALMALATDPVRAGELLDGLGWHKAADGIRRDGQGERLALKLQTFPDRPELPVVAAAVQEQMRQLGIAVEVAIGNSSDIPAGHRNGTLQMALGARNYATIPDPSVTLLQDFAAAGSDWGAMGWSDPALVAALTSLQGPAGEAARIAARRQVAAILQAELPAIPIAWNRLVAAVQPWITGFSLDPLERSYRISRMRWQS